MARRGYPAKDAKEVILFSFSRMGNCNDGVFFNRLDEFFAPQRADLRAMLLDPKWTWPERHGSDG